MDLDKARMIYEAMLESGADPSALEDIRAQIRFMEARSQPQRGAFGMQAPPQPMPQQASPPSFQSLMSQIMPQQMPQVAPSTPPQMPQGGQMAQMPTPPMPQGGQMAQMSPPQSPQPPQIMPTPPDRSAMIAKHLAGAIPRRPARVPFEKPPAPAKKVKATPFVAGQRGEPKSGAHVAQLAQNEGLKAAVSDWMAANPKRALLGPRVAEIAKDFGLEMSQQQAARLAKRFKKSASEIADSYIEVGARRAMTDGDSG